MFHAAVHHADGTIAINHSVGIHRKATVASSESHKTQSADDEDEAHHVDLCTAINLYDSGDFSLFSIVTGCAQIPRIQFFSCSSK